MRIFKPLARPAMVMLVMAANTCFSAELAEPPIFTSANGVLDLLMVARPAPIPTLAPYAPTGWVYDICQRAVAAADACPGGGGNSNPYGGTRLQLQAGDTLKVRLVNRLPPVPEAKHAVDPGEDFLTLNPTNIHTHGMLVSPHVPTVGDPTYGDNVFVLTLNGANGVPGPDAHLHSDARLDYTDYAIKVPANHPSGLFWFHPHVHGIALNQVSAGLSGLITVGDPLDYVCHDGGCKRFARTLPIRHILLKDAQILRDSTLQDQEDPGFCSSDAGAPPSFKGFCNGTDQTAAGGPDYRGGKWFFTLNGQRYPTISETSSNGEIWRITAATGSNSFNLDLWNAAQSQEMVVQVLAIDGVAVTDPDSIDDDLMAKIGGKTAKPVPCPGNVRSGVAFGRRGLCVTRLLMLPSSRVELWVAYRDATGKLAAPPTGAEAVLRTIGYQTGPTGDDWPAVDLAKVTFKAGSRSADAPASLAVTPAATDLVEPLKLAAALQAANHAVGVDPNCRALAPRHVRRIFFGVPADNPNGFGLGYEELDEHGRPVPGTFMDIHPFDPDRPTICLPLNAHNAPATERWQLVNLAGETHNFHLHQVKFQVIGDDDVDDQSLPTKEPGQTLLHDNVPLIHADGDCGGVDGWRHGACTAHPVTVQVPFTVAGDFVYHCHILEHEDGGMMARIRVRPAS